MLFRDFLRMIADVVYVLEKAAPQLASAGHKLNMGRPNFNTAQKPQQQQQQHDVEEGNESQNDGRQPQSQVQHTLTPELHREIVERHRKRVKARLYMLTLLLVLAVLTSGYMLSTCIPVFYNIFVEERVDLYAPDNDTNVNEKYTQLETNALQQLFDYRAQLENDLNNEKFLRRVAEKELQRVREQNGILLARLRMLSRPLDSNDSEDNVLEMKTTTSDVNTDAETTTDNEGTTQIPTSTTTAESHDPNSVIWSEDDLVQESWSKKRPLNTEEFEKEIQKFLG